MSKVLIVDDEEDYRFLMEIALANKGYDIRTASNGREAIDVGTRYRPDVVIADWMLKDHIHGLHVVETLRLVIPEMRSILVTGFASADLRTDAAKARVVDFIDKPFERDRIQASVRDAMNAKPVQGEDHIFGVIEVNADGAIVFANTKAKELFDDTDAGREAANLSDVFPSETMDDLDSACDHWIPATPRSSEPTSWRVRSQRPNAGGSRLIVLRRENEPPRYQALIEMLLGVEDRGTVSWPFAGRVLVLDDDALLRKAIVGTLEDCGAACYAADSLAHAERLLVKDEGLAYAILDFDMPASTPAEAIEKITTIRPDVVIIGTSGLYHREDFAALGVERFLQKPWLTSDLINVIMGRIGKCMECGLPLPLRRPKRDEEGERWMCAFCGSRYRAILDDSFPPDVMRNARQPIW